VSSSKPSAGQGKGI